MEQLTERDVKIFYQLFTRYDEISRNIGIIGNKQKFNRYVDIVSKEFKNTKAKILKSQNGKIVRIILDDIEYGYIHIESIDDLKGFTFRKFI